MKFSNKLQFLPVSFVALIIGFQNCSDVDLVSLNPNQIQAAAPTPTPTPTPIPTPGVVDGVAAYAISTNGGCALKENSAYCWGANGSGLIGPSIPSGYPPGSTPAFSLRPVRIDLPTTLQYIKLSLSVYGNHACVETTDSQIFCWGGNGGGALGNPSVATNPHALSTTPVAVVAPAGVRLHGVSAGVYHTCALSATGQPYCWGYNGGGELGLGYNSHTANVEPRLITLPAGVSFTSVSAGFQHTCGLTASGTIYCWGGLNVYGEIGNAATPVHRDPATPQYITPAIVSSPSGVVFTSVSAGVYSTCATTTTNAVYCWGENGHGQLGNATIPVGMMPDGRSHYSKVPLAYLESEGPFIHTSAGGMLNCATTLNGRALCRGQYAPATNSASAVNAPLSGDGFVTAMASGNTACGLTSSGGLYCWGSNFFGALGIGNDLPSVSWSPLLVDLP